MKISLKFIPEDWINNKPALVQTMAWREIGDMLISDLPTIMHLA